MRAKLTIETSKRGRVIRTDSHELGGRADLVAAVNLAMRRADLSGRARRQVNLVTEWRYLTTRGDCHFSIHDTCGARVELRACGERVE